jgi:hypothetical protein
MVIGFTLVLFGIAITNWRRGRTPAPQKSS